MNDTYFDLGSLNRTAQSSTARIIIVILTFMLLIPTLMIAIIATIIYSVAPGIFNLIVVRPANSIWSTLLMLLLKSSDAWDGMPRLRLLLMIVGIPLALIAYVLVGCLPPLPNPQAKNSRLALCDQWPLTRSLWRQLERRQLARMRVSSVGSDAL